MRDMYGICMGYLPNVCVCMCVCVCVCVRVCSTRIIDIGALTHTRRHTHTYTRLVNDRFTKRLVIRVWPVYQVVVNLGLSVASCHVICVAVCVCVCVCMCV